MATGKVLRRSGDNYPDTGGLALGRATFAAAKVATSAFDVLRILDRHPSASLYDDPLGRLEWKLKALMAKAPNQPGLADYTDILGHARTARNDLLHALTARDGLYRRRAEDHHYEVKYFDVASIDAVTVLLSEVARQGNRVLYADGGASVEAWYRAGGG